MMVRLWQAGRAHPQGDASKAGAVPTSSAPSDPPENTQQSRPDLDSVQNGLRLGK